MSMELEQEAMQEEREVEINNAMGTLNNKEYQDAQIERNKLFSNLSEAAGINDEGLEIINSHIHKSLRAAEPFVDYHDMSAAERQVHWDAKAKVVQKLPTEAKDRKAIPLTTGVLDYFPDALVEVAKTSKAGNDQHNPGMPLHWSKDKSTDHADCIARHLVDRGLIDDDGCRHSAKLAWRALALLQLEIEAAKNEKV